MRFKKPHTSIRNVQSDEQDPWDMTSDDIVNIFELILVVSHFGEEYCQTATESPNAEPVNLLGRGANVSFPST